MALANLEEICESARVSQIEAFNPNAPESKMARLGTLAALTSASNYNPQIQDGFSNNRSGTYKQVIIDYLPRAYGTGTNTILCSGTETQLRHQKVVTLSLISSVRGRFEGDYLQRFCAGAGGSLNDPAMLGGFIGREMSLKMKDLRLHIDQSLITLLAANFGINKVTGVNTARTIDLLAANGSINVEGDNLLNYDFVENQIEGRPIIITNSQIFHNYNRLLGIACCNQDGYNLSGTGSYDGYWDDNINTLVGANQGIVLSPGAVQMLRFNEYVGGFAGMMDGGWYGTMVDTTISGATPELPQFDYDVYFKWDDCTVGQTVPGLFYRMHLRYDLVFLANDVYGAGDPLLGQNGVFRYQFAQLP